MSDLEIAFKEKIDSERNAEAQKHHDEAESFTKEYKHLLPLAKQMYESGEYIADFVSKNWSDLRKDRYYPLSKFMIDQNHALFSIVFDQWEEHVIDLSVKYTLAAQPGETTWIIKRRDEHFDTGSGYRGHPRYATRVRYGSFFSTKNLANLDVMHHPDDKCSFTGGFVYAEQNYGGMIAWLKEVSKLDPTTFRFPYFESKKGNQREAITSLPRYKSSVLTPEIFKDAAEFGVAHQLGLPDKTGIPHLVYSKDELDYIFGGLNNNVQDTAQARLLEQEKKLYELQSKRKLEDELSESLKLKREYEEPNREHKQEKSFFRWLFNR